MPGVARRGRRAHHELAAGHALADVIVGLALEQHPHPGCQERAKALARAAFEPQGDRVFWQAGLAKVSADLARKRRADGAVGIADRVAQLDGGAGGGSGVVLAEDVVEDAQIQLAGGDTAIPGLDVANRVAGAVDALQQGAEVEPIGLGMPAPDLAQQLGAPDDLVERAGAERGQDLAHLLGDMEEEMDNLLRGTGELGAQLGALGGDADRAIVAVTGARHHAALGHQRRRAERELVGAEQRSQHHIAPGLQPTVHAQAHAAAQPVDHQRLLCLGQPELPMHTGVLDRGERRGAGATGMTTDQDDIGAALGHAGRDRADAGLGHQLHRHCGTRVGLLEIVDQLRQVLDAVDIVVRRRRDQLDPRRGMADARDLLGHFVARQLATLARLGPLRHLDLQLARRGQVGRRDAEACRGDLLDRAVALIVVARRVLAALAGVAEAAQPVHRDRQRLVGLDAGRAVRHRCGREAPDDRLDRLHFVERDRRPEAGDWSQRLGRWSLGLVEVEQVAQLGRRARVDQFAIRAVGSVVTAIGSLLQRVHDGRREGVVFTVLLELIEAGVRQRSARGDQW